MLPTKNKRTYIKKSLATSLFSLLLLAFSSGASAQQLNISDLSFTKDTNAVNDKVRQECKLIEKGTTFLRKYGKKYGFSPVTNESKDVAGAYNLTVKIIGTVGGAGGAWTGRKGLNIKGELKKDGKVVGTYEGFRSSGGRRWGWGAGFQGTCSLLGRSIRTLSSDVTKWAKTPSMNARIGELN